MLFFKIPLRFAVEFYNTINAFYSQDPFSFFLLFSLHAYPVSFEEYFDAPF